MGYGTNPILLDEYDGVLQPGYAWAREAKSMGKDLTEKELTQFRLSARVSSNSEKEQSRMLMAMKRAVIAHVAKAKKG